MKTEIALEISERYMSWKDACTSRTKNGAVVNQNDGFAKSQPAEYRKVIKGNRRGDKLLVPLGVQTGICPLRGANDAACSPVVHWIL